MFLWELVVFIRSNYNVCEREGVCEEIKRRGCY